MNTVGVGRTEYPNFRYYYVSQLKLAITKSITIGNYKLVEGLG